MPVGTIMQMSMAPLSGLSARTTNLETALFTRYIRPERFDMGLVSKDQAFPVYLHNGESVARTVSAINASGQVEGIGLDLTTPATIAPHTSQRIVVSVDSEGPAIFEALFSFLTTATNDPLWTILGTRPPQLSGDIGYLFFPHNWENGLDESLAWKTDVMIAHDRTEQRVQLRTLPRRTWEVRMLVSGAGRRQLETWLGMRKSRYLFAPIWRDAVRLTGDIAAGATTIPITEGSDNFVIGTPVAVWTDWQTAEVRTITGVGATYLAVDAPFGRDWQAGLAWMAPCRSCLSLEQRRVSRFTEDVGDYQLSLLATDDGWEPSGGAVELYLDVPLCPFVPSWEDGEEGYDNKWVRLDNDTGVLEFDVQSEEPVLSRDARFLLVGRADINTFLAFLKARGGRLAPFWLAANDRGFELSVPAEAGASFIVIQPIGYEYALKDSAARQHLELITTDGTIIRRKVLGVETLASGEEKLTLDAALPVAVSAEALNRCAWLELCRLDSDEITVHWVTAECAEVTLPIVVLP